MHTTTLIPRDTLSLGEFKTLIESLPGGAWGGAIGVPRGVIDAERGHVYVDYDDKYGNYFNSYLDEQRKAELLARLGHSPQLALHIQASVVDVGSKELAEDICCLLLSKWGGEFE